LSAPADAEPSYREKYRLLDFLKRESRRSRQRKCMAVASGDTVSVVESSAGGVGFAGLQTCGSITCPWCGPKIGAGRCDEIIAAVELHRATGGRVLFGTLTLRHNRGQSHAELADAIATSWHRATGGRGWADDRRSYGIVGTIRVWETKFNDANGWHVHVHFLVFVGAGWVDPEKLMASMFTRWQRAAVSLGLAAPLLVGQDLHEVTGEQAAQQLGGYFAKEAIENGLSTAEALGWELTGGDGKTRGESFTPGQLLQLASLGDRKALALFNEYELSMKGRRSIAFSRGLRELLELDIWKSDAEIAAGEDLADTVEILRLPARVFRKIARDGLRGEVLDVAREFGAVTLTRWLLKRGYPLYDDMPGGGTW
jgi:hypothetical protein